MRKINIKKWSGCIRFALVVVLIFATGFGIQCLKSIHIHFNINLADYAEIYIEQLDEVFGDDYEIGRRKTVSEYRAECCGHRYFDYYYTWEIRYKDYLGDEYTAELTNDDPEFWSFERQAFYWMSDQAAEHFIRTCQKADYSEEIHWEYIRYLDPTNPESSVIVNAFEDDLLDSFKELDGLPHLYEMRYEDWFVTYPSFFTIDLRGNDRRNEILNDLAVGLGEETNGRFNLELYAGYDTRDGEYYVMGEPKQFEYPYDFIETVFYEYEKMGMFD